VTGFLERQAQPARLPPAPFAKAGATAYLDWKEWLARNE
jgi:hypothetical protein